eukprot:GHVU01176766.1.p3 GENE.GHVU01176766.1~~GHVU01176766.1.p3  ORF type:complete len:104 (+),score=6.27 GHVU01176766.1:267-578(+)
MVFLDIRDLCRESRGANHSFHTSGELAGEVVGNFRRLRKVRLEGEGAIEWFSRISERCAPTLDTAWIRGPQNRELAEVPGNFMRLIDFVCDGWTLSECRIIPV